MTASGQYWQFKYLSLPAWCGLTPTGMRNERHHTVNKELICRDHRPQKIYLGLNKSFNETPQTIKFVEKSIREVHLPQNILY